MPDTPIKRIRARRELTQVEVAAKARISVKQYRRYEQGAISPPLNVAARIADVFDVTLDHLAGRVRGRVWIGDVIRTRSPS